MHFGCKAGIGIYTLTVYHYCTWSVYVSIRIVGFSPVLQIPTTVEFVDIAGLVKGASKGEGLGNKFLATIREVDAIVQVVRCFEDGDVVHVDGTVNPEADAEVINFELALSDIAQIEKRLERLKSSKPQSHKNSLCA